MALQENVKHAMRTRVRSRWPLFELFMLILVAVIGWAAWGSWELMTELEDSRRTDRRRQQNEQLTRQRNELTRLLELHAIRDDYLGFEKHVQPALQDMRLALTRFAETYNPADWRTFEMNRRTVASWMERLEQRTRARDLTTLSAWVEKRALASTNAIERPSLDVVGVVRLLRDGTTEYVASATFIEQMTHQSPTPRHTPGLSGVRRAEGSPTSPTRDPERRDIIKDRLKLADQQWVNLMAHVEEAHRRATAMQWFIELHALSQPLAGLDTAEPLQDLQTRFLPFIYTLSAGLVGLCIFSGVAMYRRFVVAPLHLKLIERETIMEQQKKFAHFEKLTAVLAHEIKQPLSAINVWVWTLQKSLAEGTAEYKGAQIIRTELNRVDQIVKDFLKLTQPVDPKFVSMKSEPLLQEIADFLRPKLERSAIKLKLDSTTGEQFEGDPQQLKQVVLNLVQNAAESIGERGQITLRSRRDRIILKGEKTDAVVIEVEDNGPGIPAEVQERLFDPFFSTKENGTGLGLAIAAKIVDKHEGALVFETQQGHGTTFGVVLPIQKR